MKFETISRQQSAAVAILALAGSLMLGACNRQEDPSQTSRDISEARTEGNEKVGEATKDAVENFEDGASAKTVVNDVHRIEVEKIRADHEVAKQRCDGIVAADQDKCRSDADATYDAAMKLADEKRKANGG
ncbi:hypothetical protein DFR24_2671 [Panacagrimonas perspica]|uniref:Uncharacterized protein n=1 Tax=Panacagrimonas perspica TaxID=381431 RepID=A0A4R7P3G5_9GAMM|nr:hypothetical protein [Panacagrimonas perspica]TDU28303.1 hypothetical protein DFR24_2671 [Panacagrimonas perspica]THD02468.1 hypothetical protein B1810_14625 [Panacagrimonas perspica]